MEETAKFRKFNFFREQNALKILAKWWDLPPTVGQILIERKYGAV
jgi:hypothetical protein